MPKNLPHRQLGSTGLKVSCLGLGTVKFGRNTGVKYPESFSLPDDQALEALLSTAKNLGINYLEARLGKLIQPNRQDWVISTKVGEYFSNGKSHYDFTESTSIASVELSLKRFGTDQLDIVFVHSNGDDQEIIQSSPVLECLSRLRDKGWIRAIGFSGKDAAASSLAIDLVDVFMVTLNQSDTSQASLLKSCKQQGKGVVIKKALASGHASSPNAALKFAIDYEGVSSVIVGTINPNHLAQNVSVAIKR